MPTDDKSGSFSIKDKFSILISTVALVISSLSFYFGNVRVEDNLQVRILKANKGPESKDSIPWDTAFIEVAYINAGNRQSIVDCPSFELSDTIEFKYHSVDPSDTVGFNKSFADGFVHELRTSRGKFVNDNSFPFILQPHEMKIIKLCLPFDKFSLKYRRPNYVNFNDRKLFQSFCNIIFYGYDSHAELHIKESGNQLRILTDTSRIIWIYDNEKIANVRIFLE